MQKPDYNKQMLDLIDSLPKQQKPTLLLHACCGPCSSHVLECLAEHFDITVYYYNPNIYPQEEYTRRLNELKDFLPRFLPATQNSVKLIQEHYEPQEFYGALDIAKNPQLAHESEKGERCRKCYRLRLEQTYRYAVQNGFDYFTTTLSISPYKDAEMINQIGSELCTQNSTGTAKFLHSDFKKKNGYLRSLELSREYGLYRQDYCGCVYSKTNTELEREQKKECNRQ